MIPDPDLTKRSFSGLQKVRASQPRRPHEFGQCHRTSKTSHLAFDARYARCLISNDFDDFWCVNDFEISEVSPPDAFSCNLAMKACENGLLVLQSQRSSVRSVRSVRSALLDLLVTLLVTLLFWSFLICLDMFGELPVLHHTLRSSLARHLDLASTDAPAAAGWCLDISHGTDPGFVIVCHSLSYEFHVVPLIVLGFLMKHLIRSC